MGTYTIHYYNGLFLIIVGFVYLNFRQDYSVKLIFTRIMQ